MRRVSGRESAALSLASPSCPRNRQQASTRVSGDVSAFLGSSQPPARARRRRLGVVAAGTHKLAAASVRASDFAIGPEIAGGPYRKAGLNRAARALRLRLRRGPVRKCQRESCNCREHDRFHFALPIDGYSMKEAAVCGFARVFAAGRVKRASIGRQVERQSPALA